LAAWLRQQGHDAVHAADLGLHRASDADIMAQAVREAQTIVTADLDYPRLLAMSEATAPGIVLFRDGEWSEAGVIARMEEVLATLTEADLAQSIIVVDRSRVRRRRLPLGS
jgi:predicted nuclease of predicted toxin-antitoxin system